MTPEEDFAAFVQVDLQKVRSDVAEYGWHMVLITGGEDPRTDPGFLFTVGLWKTFGHPEILLFTPYQQSGDLASNVDAVVERIRQGERFESGKGYEGLFGVNMGALRPVESTWYPTFLGTAMGYYEGIDFPALQLFWPDREGHFPWDPGFDPDLRPFQPLLQETLLSRANLPAAVLRELSTDEDAGVTLNPEDLFIELDAEVKDLLLEDWSWLVGEEAQVFRVTLFGDVFTQTPDGHVHWLDTGWGSYQDVAESLEQWAEAVNIHGFEWFHIAVLLDLRSLGVELQTGQVYSWRHLPMLGGAETVDNVDFTSAVVHVSHSGRVAESIKNVPPGAKVQVRWTPVGPAEDLSRRKHLLALGGWLSAAVAALHVVIAFVGPPAYRYFGAGEDMARRAEAGSLFPAALTLGIAAVLAVFALYAFAGIGWVRRPLLLRAGLAAISAIYLARGLLLLPELIAFALDSGAVQPRHLLFSFTSLVIGVLYVTSTVSLWSSLKSRQDV